MGSFKIKDLNLNEDLYVRVGWPEVQDFIEMDWCS